MSPAYATLWKRILASGLDYILISAYIIVLTGITAAVGAVAPALIGVPFGDPISGHLTAFLILTVPVGLYFALSESSAQQGTWGKHVMKLRVVTTDGERISLMRALARTLLKLTPWELAHTCIWGIPGWPTHVQSFPPLVTAGLVVVWVLVGANVVSVLISPKRQALYDWMGGTVVATTRDAIA